MEEKMDEGGRGVPRPHTGQKYKTFWQHFTKQNRLLVSHIYMYTDRYPQNVKLPSIWHFPRLFSALLPQLWLPTSYVTNHWAINTDRSL